MAWRDSGPPSKAAAGISWILRNAGAALLAAPCTCCGQPMGWGRYGVCPFCWREVVTFPVPACGACGEPLSRNPEIPHLSCRRADCVAAGWRVRAAVACGPYRGRLRGLVHALKYGGNPRLAKPLGRMIAEMICRSGLAPWAEESIIVPVPLPRARMVERGYNQAELIARQVARSLRSRGTAPDGPARVLRRSDDGTPQTGLSRKERLKSPQGQFAPGRTACRRIAGRRILLIDDVVTTGATLQACVRALVRSGAGDVTVAVVARTPAPEGPDPRAAAPSHDARRQEPRRRD